LKDSGITLFKLGLPETLDYPEWLRANLKSNDVVGFDAKVFTVALAQKLSKLFALKNIKLNSSFDLIDNIWKDRKSIPLNAAFEHELKYAGKTRIEKFKEIRSQMEAQSADYHI